MRNHAVMMAAALLLLGGHRIHAGDRLGLILVWTRVADVNGEAGSVESAEFSPQARRRAGINQ